MEQIVIHQYVWWEEKAVWIEISLVQFLCSINKVNSSETGKSKHIFLFKKHYEVMNNIVILSIKCKAPPIAASRNSDLLYENQKVEFKGEL
jgi:hypothetical protein